MIAFPEVIQNHFDGIVEFLNEEILDRMGPSVARDDIEELHTQAISLRMSNSSNNELDGFAVSSLMMGNEYMGQIVYSERTFFIHVIYTVKKDGRASSDFVYSILDEDRADSFYPILKVVNGGQVHFNQNGAEITIIKLMRLIQEDEENQEDGINTWYEYSDLN